MAFCQNCGNELPAGAKFCSECGTPAGSVAPVNNNSQRQQEYAGKILKCPNCGTPIDGLTAICPSCGFHITNRTVSVSVQEFQNELMEIEKSRKNSTANKFLGLLGGKIEDNADIQKISLIRNYPIPNTIEEISEFMYLAASNINVNLSKKSYYNNRNVDIYKAERNLSNAWVSKMEQCYRKAEASFPNDPAFERIKETYYTKMKELKFKIK